MASKLTLQEVITFTNHCKKRQSDKTPDAELFKTRLLLHFGMYNQLHIILVYHTVTIASGGRLFQSGIYCICYVRYHIDDVTPKCGGLCRKLSVAGVIAISSGSKIIIHKPLVICQEILKLFPMK